MILVDDRTGSKHLVAPLEKLQLPATLARLQFGDVAFAGLGPGGDSVKCGIEIKSIREMVDDLTNPRFSGHQLPGLLNTYDYSWLLVEGAARANPYNGRLEVPRARNWVTVKLGSGYIPYSVLWAHLHTLSIKTGLPIIRTYLRTETYAQIKTLYRWWEKGWEAHMSHDRTYKRPVRYVADMGPASLVRRMAAELPGIGQVRSAVVDAAFPSVFHMVSAPVEEWAAIEGIGKDTAKKVVAELEGR